MVARAGAAVLLTAIVAAAVAAGVAAGVTAVAAAAVAAAMAAAVPAGAPAGTLAVRRPAPATAAAALKRRCALLTALARVAVAFVLLLCCGSVVAFTHVLALTSTKLSFVAACAGSLMGSHVAAGKLAASNVTIGADQPSCQL